MGLEAWCEAPCRGSCLRDDGGGWLHALGGRFAALQGQEGEALRHVNQALELFALEHDQDLPPFASYLSEAEINSTCGEVLLFLSRTSGHPHHARDAVTMLTSAERSRPEKCARSRAFDSVGAARSLLVIDDLDGAREVGLRSRSSVGWGWPGREVILGRPRLD